MHNQTRNKNPNAQTIFAEELLAFIRRSPTPFHAVENAVAMLAEAGYQAISDEDHSNSPKQFYLTHNDSSLIAVSLNAPIESGFNIVGAHTDSPCLKIKPNAVYQQNEFMQLGVEVYGGALLAPWFDRDLSLAGRVTALDNQGGLVSRLVDFENAIGIIPSLAIHLNRGVNDKNEINKQKHLPPLLALKTEADLPSLEGILLAQLKQEHPTEKFDSVLAYELSLYDTQEPAIIGLDQNLIASARLDNLLSCFVALRSLLDRKPNSNAVVVMTDHEEVGSTSASGAAGPFLASALKQICGDDAHYHEALKRSMLISADNAHSLHPNYPEQHEPRHQPIINQGPVIKTNHNQRYASNSETNAFFAQICKAAEVPYQQFVVRSDMGCGSTIGPITAAELGVKTVDIGVPQLAMHSIRELAGVEDCDYLHRALIGFFQQKNFIMTSLRM